MSALCPLLTEKMSAFVSAFDGKISSKVASLPIIDKNRIGKKS